MSVCLVAYCLAHRKRVFLQGWGPEKGLWLHSDGWPCLWCAADGSPPERAVSA